MEIIAKCKRCGRGFVAVNPDSDMIDHYYPADKPQPRVQDMPWGDEEECGGRIVMLQRSPENETEST